MSTMDKIASIKREAVLAHRATRGRLGMVSISYRTKCNRDAFLRGWYEYENRFPFTKRIEE